MPLPSSRRPEKEKDLKDKGSASDEDMKKLLNYFRLDEYTGLVPILKKLGSDTTSLNALLMCAVTFLFASGLKPMNLITLMA